MSGREDVAFAIRQVVAFLQEEYIIDSCEGHETFGCMSCQAIALKKQLLGVHRDLVDDEPSLAKTD